MAVLLLPAALSALFVLGSGGAAAAAEQKVATPALRHQFAILILDAGKRSSSGSLINSPFKITKAFITEMRSGALNTNAYDDFYCVWLEGDRWGTVRLIAVSVSRLLHRSRGLFGKTDVSTESSTRLYFMDDQDWTFKCGRTMQRFPELVGKTFTEKPR
ncbi:MAG: hypothetical protein FWD68_03975 [Alphaproteobacteria bacterium]|nr:hypothetical protein [Alphaproteobacteria bacterium]